MSELKPCPLCKSNKILVGDDLNAINELYGYVICLKCGLKMEGFKGNWEDAKKFAITKWNRRASPWVRVEDGLPEHYQDVLIKLVRCSDSIISATWHGIDNHFFSNVSGHDYPDATHWMPIPEIEG